jgi:uncharacterized protein
VQTAPAPETSPARDPAGAKRRGVRGQKWTRLIHVYLSMISFAVVFFFAATGLTLNHAEWTFGTKSQRVVTSGTVPVKAVTGAAPDWFTIAEHVRDVDHIRGSVTQKDSDGRQVTVSFRAPGYSADVRIDAATGSYELAVEQHGWVAAMNDLHKGRDSRRSWHWLIDASAGLLILVSASGLVLQFYLRKRRRSALTSLVIGAIVVALAVTFAVR